MLKKEIGQVERSSQRFVNQYQFFRSHLIFDRIGATFNLMFEINVGIFVDRQVKLELLKHFVELLTNTNSFKC